MGARGLHRSLSTLSERLKKQLHYDTMSFITLTSGTTEKSLADWGFDLNHCELERHNAAQDTLSLRLPGAVITDTPLFAFEDRVTLRVGRARGGSAGSYTYSGGALKFQGKRLHAVLDLRPKAAAVSYQFAGPWYDLEHCMYQQTTTVWGGSGPVSVFQPQVILFTRIDPVTGGLIPATTADQITDALQFLLEQYSAQSMAAPFQIGTIDTSTLDAGGSVIQVNAPSLISKPLMCSDVIQKCLQISPDCKLWFDYSTSPPTVHVRRQSALDGLTLPLADGVSHKSLRLIPRYDLQVRGVAIHFKITNDYNGRDYVQDQVDSAPAGAPTSGLRVAVDAVDIKGVSVTNVQTTVVAAALPVAGASQSVKRAWWARQQSKFDPAHSTIRFQDAAGAATSIPDATIVYENADGSDSGVAADITTYPNQLMDGSVHPWMLLAGGAAVVGKRVIVKAAMTYAEYDVDGSTPADTDTNGVRRQMWLSKTETKRITLTNSPAGSITYTGISSLSPGEPVPVGLAQCLYRSLSVLQYEGEYIQVTAAPGTAVNLDNNLNISDSTGGALPGAGADWLTMNALIQGIHENLGRGVTEISVGPARHLNAEELKSILNFWRFRTVWCMTPASAPAVMPAGAPRSPSILRCPRATPREAASTSNPASKLWRRISAVAPPAMPKSTSTRIS